MNVEPRAEELTIPLNCFFFVNCGSESFARDITVTWLDNPIINIFKALSNTVFRTHDRVKSKSVVYRRQRTLQQQQSKPKKKSSGRRMQRLRGNRRSWLRVSEPWKSRKPRTLLSWRQDLPYSKLTRCNLHFWRMCIKHCMLSGVTR